LRASECTLRLRRVFAAVRGAISAASGQAFRVVHFSVQPDHVHLLVEADSTQALARGVRALVIRVARAHNRVLDCRGALFADRYHQHALRTPLEVRHALLYVLHNWKKHVENARGIDTCSSGPWFDGWSEPQPAPPAGVPSPVAAPKTWLVAKGWRRHGLLSLSEAPRDSLG
jgi:REP element-mobilizing transposase RayT